MAKSSLKDALKVMTGQDLDRKPVKRAKTKKVETIENDNSGSESKSAKKPERKDVATDDAKFAAYDYAHKADKLSEDVQNALKSGALTPDLEKLLQVLFDKAAVRELVAAQGGVRAPIDPNAYTLDFEFTQSKTGENCDEQAQTLLEGGMKLEDLESFNIKLKVTRKKADGTEVDGTDEDYEEIKKKISANQDKAKAKAKAS